MEYPTTTSGLPKTVTGEEIKPPKKESKFKKLLHRIFVHNFAIKVVALLVAVCLFVLRAGLV